ncbi:hypothetical protein BOX15_Mlig002312g1, partial [Macrostomum lignano]
YHGNNCHPAAAAAANPAADVGVTEAGGNTSLTGPINNGYNNYRGGGGRGRGRGGGRGGFSGYRGRGGGRGRGRGSGSASGSFLRPRPLPKLDRLRCSVCESPAPKYRCPGCQLARYCSTACCARHRAGCNAKEERETREFLAERRRRQLAEEQKKQPPPAPCAELLDLGLDSEDYLAAENLARLRQCPQLIKLLGNPELRELLVRLNGSRRPEADLERAMQLPLFVDFANVCLGVIEPANTD